MANIAFPRGLEPYGNLLRVTEYTLSAAYAQNLFIGDPVELSGTGRNVVIATGATINPLTGSITGIYDLDKVPLAYWDSGHTGIGYVTVADDPKQLFVAQNDGDTSIIGTTDSHSNCNLVAGAGSTVNYRSGWMIDDSEVSQDVADQIRLIRPVQRDDNTAGLANCDWIIQINDHTQSVGVLGIPV